MLIMSSRGAKKDEKNEEKTTTSGVIDVEEVLEDGAPVELARVIGVAYDRLREVKWQCQREGNWRYLKRVMRFTSGPDAEIDELCSRVVKTCLEDAHKNGPAQAYRVRLGLYVEGSDKLEYRYPGVKIRTNQDGELIAIDAAANAESMGDPLMARITEISDLLVNSLKEVTSATERIGNIGGGIARVLEVQTDILEKAAGAMTSDAELQVRLRELEHEDNVAWAEWKTREERIRTLGRMGDKIAEPVGEALGQAVKIFTEMFGEHFFGEKGPMAQQWSTFIDDLSDDERAKFRAIFTDDEWSVAEAAREAKDDAAFAAQFRKMLELIGQHSTQEDFLEKVSKAVGAKIMKLIPIWKKMQEMGL